MTVAHPSAPPAPPEYLDPDFALLPDGRRVERIEDIIRARAAATPSAPALTTSIGSLTFAELDLASNRVANALVARGVGPGDRVCYIGSNHASFLELLYGAAKMGAVPTAANTRLHPDELAYLLGDCEPALVVLGPGSGHLNDLVVSLGIPVVSLDPVDGATAYCAWVAAAAETDPGFRRDPDAMALMFYSSGTTGRPKGVELRAQAFGRALAAMHYLMDFEVGSVALAPLPFFHISGLGLALAATLNGAELLLLAPGSPAELCRVLQEHRVSHTVMVPTVVADLLALPETRTADWSALKYITYGAAAMPVGVLEEAIEVFDCAFMQSYGLTEATGGVTMLTDADHRSAVEHPDRLLSVGRAMPGTLVRVVATGTLDDVAPGVVGEIVIGGPRVMLGYWRNEAATAEAVGPGGWLRTGDGGWMDADGYLHLTDRIKDMIVSGGENVYPAEVESLMSRHPGIREVAVVGAPSARWGESPVALVVRADGLDGSQLTEPELIAWTRDRIAHFKCPVAVRFLDALPRNASGKVLKHALRDQVREVLA